MTADEAELRAGVYEALLAASRRPVSLGELTPDLPLAELGIDSLGVMSVLVQLEARFCGDLALLGDAVSPPGRISDLMGLARRLAGASS
jgi:acyl carrier protein